MQMRLLKCAVLLAVLLYVLSCEKLPSRTMRYICSSEGRLRQGEQEQEQG